MEAALTIVYFTLAQRLVESLTQRDVMLGLCAVQELLQLKLTGARCLSLKQTQQIYMKNMSVVSFGNRA